MTDQSTAADPLASTSNNPETQRPTEPERNPYCIRPWPRGYFNDYRYEYFVEAVSAAVILNELLLADEELRQDAESDTGSGMPPMSSRVRWGVLRAQSLCLSNASGFGDDLSPMFEPESSRRSPLDGGAQ